MTFAGAMLFVLSLFLMTSTAFETTQIQQREVRARDLDSTGTSGFIARTGHSTIVVGDYLYFDGGELYYNESGTVAVYPENSTYSIDLTFTWTNDTDTLPFYQINKGDAPVLDSPAFWIDNANTSFYSYDGLVVANSDQSNLSNSLWQFTPDGTNYGSWAPANTLSNSIFPTLQRTRGQASAYGNAVGYALGGMDYSNVPTPGLVSYNTTSGLWANMTTSGFTDSGTSMFGQLQHVPGFGPAGLLVAFGGQTSDRAAWVPTQNLLSFQSISIFDPVFGIWANQTVSGSIPPPRTHFCSVGVPGDNGTFEIFIFGGQPQGDNSNPPSDAELQAALDLDAVYVLSLPAFNWQKASYTPRRSRALHTCDVIGRRQMVVVGGKQPWLPDQSQTTDFWSQGVGIFDLSNMEWMDHYDALAAPYVTPDVVKTWYNENGLYPASWSNATVESWFNPTAKHTSSNLAPIAGGVVGGILGLLLIGLVTWLFLRRRSNKPEARSHDEWHKLESRNVVGYQKSEARPRDEWYKMESRNGVEHHKPELDTDGGIAFHYRNKMAPVELDARRQPFEKDAPRVYQAAELDSRRQPYEKDALRVYEAAPSEKYELP